MAHPPIRAPWCLDLHSTRLLLVDTFHPVPRSMFHEATAGGDAPPILCTDRPLMEKLLASLDNEESPLFLCVDAEHRI
jgi:hypothetical protein